MLSQGLNIEILDVGFLNSCSAGKCSAGRSLGFITDRLSDGSMCVNTYSLKTAHKSLFFCIQSDEHNV